MEGAGGGGVGGLKASKLSEHPPNQREKKCHNVLGGNALHGIERLNSVTLPNSSSIVLILSTNVHTTVF